MPLIEWAPGLSVGVKEFDAQHQKLIKLINDLHAAMGAGQGKQALGNILGDLITYTAQHFANEEKLMGWHLYSGLDPHRQEHQKLVAQVEKFAQEMQAGKVLLTLEVMNFLKDWLNQHILGTDKKYGPFFNGLGIS